MKKGSLGSCIAAVAGGAVAVSASASVIPTMTLGEIYAQSDGVVHGRVIAQQSQWEDRDGNNLIFTYSRVQVFAGMKGVRAGDEVVVRTVGGSVDGYNQTLVGEASVRPGEEVLVFLSNEPGWSRPAVTGFHQGKFRVERDALTGGVELVRDEGQNPGHAAADVTDRAPLAQLAADLDQAMRSPTSVDEHGHVVHVLQPAHRMLDTGTTDPGMGLLRRSLERAGCPADLNNDGVVDGRDLSMILGSWRAATAVADVDGDDFVDARDLSLILGAWGACP